jgi:F0F1-type ATP synthase epsilon subunit
MSAFRVEILTPGRAWPVEQVTLLDVPAEKGRMTVLDRHQPFVCAIAGGVARIRVGDGEQRWTVGPGTLVVRPALVTLLVRDASPPAPPSP